MIPDGSSAVSTEFRAIGVIRTPFVEAPGTPIQPAYGNGIEGQVWLDESCAPALDGIESFERVWLIYWMDRAGPFRPRVVPYRDTREYGLFATRAPNRPNPIGISVVRLLRREGRVLHVSDIDVIDNTPLLDLKPYVPQFDAFPASRAGWFDKPGVDRRVADDRFHPPAGTGKQGRSG
jgi:tRNA (adenine37-N6)-methyltransferase